MTALTLASFIGQSIFVFAAVLSAMVVLGRRRPPVPLQSMNDSALQKLAVGPDVERKTFDARDGTSLAFRELVVPGKVCRKAWSLLPGDGASAVQVSRYEAQAKGPNGISESYA